MKEYAYKHEMTVRDYELDFQGVVHNSNYQRYLEHARHEFLKSRGGSMSALHLFDCHLSLPPYQISLVCAPL